MVNTSLTSNWCPAPSGILQWGTVGLKMFNNFMTNLAAETMNPQQSSCPQDSSSSTGSSVASRAGKLLSPPTKHGLGGCWNAAPSFELLSSRGAWQNWSLGRGKNYLTKSYEMLDPSFPLQMKKCKIIFFFLTVLSTKVFLLKKEIITHASWSLIYWPCNKQPTPKLCW